MKHKWVLSSALAVMTAILLAAPTTAVAQPTFASRILQASGINERADEQHRRGEGQQLRAAC